LSQEVVSSGAPDGPEDGTESIYLDLFPSSLVFDQGWIDAMRLAADCGIVPAVTLVCNHDNAGNKENEAAAAKQEPMNASS
jgi:hypothetical protein